MSSAAPIKQPTVAIIGGGLAGISAGSALADAGYRVELFERRPYLGGRASSYELPGNRRGRRQLPARAARLLHQPHRFLSPPRRRRPDPLVRRDHLHAAGRASRRSCKPSCLPAPMHARPAFLASSVLDLKDKLAISRALMALMPSLPPDDGEDFLSWLRRHGQTRQSIDRFWAPVLISALNEDLDHVSVRYAALVFRDSFLKSAEAGRMGLPAVPLSQLYGEPRDTSRRMAGRSICGLRLIRSELTATSCTFELAAKRFARTTQYWRLRSTCVEKLLPDTPELEPLREQTHSSTPSPITGIHLWFDREITPLEHAVLLERTIQWMFQKSKILDTRRESGETAATSSWWSARRSRWSTSRARRSSSWPCASWQSFFLLYAMPS